MKSTILSALVVLLSTTAMAQGSAGYSSAKANQASTTKHKGVKVGIVYSNLTDIVSKYSGRTESGVSYSETSHYGDHLGLAGINVGYKDNYAFTSLGYEASGTIFTNLNGSESDKVNIYKIQGDMVLPLSDMFSLLGGLNISYIDIKSEFAKLYPAIGLDLGVQGQFGDVGIMIGSQTLGMNAEAKQFDNKAEGYFSGVITQVSYTF